MRKLRWPACLLALSCLAAAPSYAAQDPYDGRWHFTVTPYVWLPSFSGNFVFNGANVEATRLDPFQNLHFAFMGAADARIGRLSFFGDVIYMDVGNDQSTVTQIVGPGGKIEVPVNVHTNTGISGFVFEGAAAYSLYHEGRTGVDVFLGFRDLDANSSLDWQFASKPVFFAQSGHLSQGRGGFDAIIGTRGQIGFPGSHWFIPYYGDVGTGESDFTAQAMGGVGYAFSWGDLKLVYRYLYYRPGNNKVIDNLSVDGVAFGATFHL
jgi:hypothetical protein